MGVTLSYSVLRARLRNAVRHQERLLNGLRLVRYGLIQGPWHPWLVRHRQRRPNPPLPVGDSSDLPPLDVQRALRGLDEDSCAPVMVLPEHVVDEIVAVARARGEKRMNNLHLEGGPIHRLAHDPQIVEVARRYLGVEPILFRTQMYWTEPHADPDARMREAAEGGRFHYDISDSRSLTLFAYLTDVGEDCGPHVVVRGSHGRRGWMRSMNRFISEAEVERRYAGRVQTITGRRGTAWFEDITCYHRQAPAERPRLMLILIYTLHRRPVAGDLPATTTRPRG